MEDGVSTDINAHKQAQEAVRESEQRFRGIVETAEEGIATHAQDGTITYVNQRMADMLGYSREDIIGKSSLDFVDDQERERIIQAREELKEQGTFSEERKLRRKDGSTLWTLSKLTAWRDTAGHFVGYLAMHTDITERKRVEEALRESEDRYRGVVEKTTAIILRMDPTGVITFANRRALDFFGYSADELIGKHAVGTIVPARETSGRDLARMVDQITADPDAFHTNANENTCKDGRRVWLEWTNSGIYDADGKLNGFLSVGIDATARKQAEEELRQSNERMKKVLEVETVGVMFWDLNTGCMVDANDTFLKLMGYSRSEVEARELTWQKLTPPEYMEMSRAEVNKFLATGRVGPYEKEYFRKDGTRHWLLFAGSSLGNNQCVEFCVDICARKRVEEALAAAHKQTQSIIDNTPAIFYALDLEGRFVMANAALAAWLNSTPEQMIGKRRHEFMPKEDADEHEANDRRVIEAGTAIEFEEYSKLQGRSITWLTTKFPLRDAQGRIYAVAGLSAEITQRKQMEEALRELNATLETKVAERTAELVESNAYNRSLIEASLDPLVTIGADGKITDVNAATETATGLTREQLVGTDFCDYFTDSTKARAGYEQVFREGAVRDFELELRHRDGHLTSVTYHATVYRDRQGKVAGVLAAARDITDRLRSQLAIQVERQRLYGVLEALPAMVCLLTPDYHVPFANSSFQERFGTPDGRRCYEFCFGQDKPCDFCQSYKVLETGQPHHWEVNPPGGHQVFDAYDFPFTDVDGSPMVLEMDIDITEFRKAQDALRLANEQLTGRAAQLRALAGELTLSEQRERRRMARLLHDQLQQLLVGCKFRLTVLSRHEDSVVQQATGEAIELLNEAVKASRSLTAELSPPILHEAGLVEGLKWLARWMAEKHGLFVDLSMPERPLSLAEDVKLLLFESARELLFNVVKHAEAKSATVSLRQIKGRQVQLTVADEGIGFEADKVRPGIDGGGFGLFSIRERLELIGGQMEVRSVPGQGSVLVLTAPMGEAPSTPLAVGELLGKVPAFEAIPPVPGAKIRVLLADDHAVMRQGLTQLLGQEPDIHVIGGAADGAEAVQLARELSPDVILMDLNMPKLNGVEASRAIHNDYPDVRIIGLSMFEEAERAQAMRDAGAVDYLTKTGPADQLIAAIRRACLPVSSAELGPQLAEPLKTRTRSQGKQPRTSRPQGRQSIT